MCFMMYAMCLGLGPLPDPMPPGYKADTAAGDGIRQLFDPGIQNIVVRLGSVQALSLTVAPF